LAKFGINLQPVRGRPQGPFKIKNSRKTSGMQSRLFEVIKTYFREKNSQFFYPPILQNTGQIMQKQPIKPCKFTPKTMRFLTCLKRALIIKREDGKTENSEPRHLGSYIRYERRKMCCFQKDFSPGLVLITKQNEFGLFD
jgi:hypothetical protein